MPELNQVIFPKSIFQYLMFRVWWTSGQSWKKNSCSRMGIFKGLKGDLIKMVAGAGFEPTTFGLWARRATRLLHPASNGSVLIITLFSVFARNYKKKSEFMYFCRFFIRKHWYSRLWWNGKTEIINQDRQRFRMCFYTQLKFIPRHHTYLQDWADSQSEKISGKRCSDTWKNVMHRDGKW